MAFLLHNFNKQKTINLFLVIENTTNLILQSFVITNVVNRQLYPALFMLLLYSWLSMAEMM
jgi:hypothetical protein